MSLEIEDIFVRDISYIEAEGIFVGTVHLEFFDGRLDDPYGPSIGQSLSAQRLQVECRIRGSASDSFGDVERMLKASAQETLTLAAKLLL